MLLFEKDIFIHNRTKSLSVDRDFHFGAIKSLFGESSGGGNGAAEPFGTTVAFKVLKEDITGDQIMALEGFRGVEGAAYGAFGEQGEIVDSNLTASYTTDFTTADIDEDCVCVDENNNVYFGSDEGSAVVRKVSSAGVQQWETGSAASISYWDGLACTDDGSKIVAVGINGKFIEIGSDGTYREGDRGGRSYAGCQFGGDDKNIFFCGSDELVSIHSAEGPISNTPDTTVNISTVPTLAIPTILSPSGMAKDRTSDGVWVWGGDSDTSAHYVLHIKADGTVDVEIDPTTDSPINGMPDGSASIWGVAVDRAGHIYIHLESSSWNDYDVLRYKPDGTFVYSISEELSLGGGVDPGGSARIAVDGEGNIYVGGSRDMAVYTQS